MRSAIGAAGALALLLPNAAPAASPASPVLQSFQISAAIVAGCSIATTGASTWGTIDLGTITGVGTASASAALLSSTGSGLQLNCTPGTSVSVTADAGQYAVGGVRQLAGPGASDRIPYQLFANGSPTAWTTQSIALSFPVGTSQLGLPIVASTSVTAPRTAGAYADVVRVTVSW